MLPANATPPTTSAAFHGPSATTRAGTNPPFFGLLSALRAHANAPYKPDLRWRTLRARHRAPAGAGQCVADNVSLASAPLQPA